MTAKHNVSIVISVTSEQHQSTMSPGMKWEHSSTWKFILPLSNSTQSSLISTFSLSIAIDIVVKGWARLFRSHKNAPHLEKKKGKSFTEEKSDSLSVAWAPSSPTYYHSRITWILVTWPIPSQLDQSEERTGALMVVSEVESQLLL